MSATHPAPRRAGAPRRPSDGGFTENAYGPKLVPVGAEGHALATLPRFLLKVLLQDQTYWPWLMRRAGVDVVHTPIFAGMVAAPRPYVLTLHDLIPLQTPEAVSRSAAAYWRLVLPRSVARADAIITGSDFTRREILDWFGLPPERVVTVWHGVDPCFAPVDDEATQARVRARYRLPARFLLFVGIASPRKNIDRLVQAFGALRDDERGDAHLLLAGPAGWKNEALEAAIAATRRVRIRHLGVVADADLPALYGLAAGVARISRAAKGSDCRRSKRSRAVRRSSAPTGRAFEVVGDAAWLVDPDDGAAVARALATVLAGGAEWVATGPWARPCRAFTWERAAAGARRLSPRGRLTAQRTSSGSRALPEAAGPHRIARQQERREREHARQLARMAGGDPAEDTREAERREQRDQRGMADGDASRQRHQAPCHRRAGAEHALVRDECAERRPIQMRHHDRRVEEEDPTGTRQLVVEGQLLGTEADGGKRRRTDERASTEAHVALGDAGDGAGRTADGELVELAPEGRRADRAFRCPVGNRAADAGIVAGGVTGEEQPEPLARHEAVVVGDGDEGAAAAATPMFWASAGNVRDGGAMTRTLGKRAVNRSAVPSPLLSTTITS